MKTPETSEICKINQSKMQQVFDSDALAAESCGKAASLRVEPWVSGVEFTGFCLVRRYTTSRQ
jgi:hypothetical protein